MGGKQDWRGLVQAGLPFVMDDMDFLACVVAAQAKVNAYNNALHASVEAMQGALAGLFGKIGRSALVLPRITVDVGFHIEIGDDSFINANATLLDTYPIRIGANVLVGPNCAFYPVGHPMRDAERTLRDPATGLRTGTVTSGAPIVVQDDVWIGGNVILLQGVTIGARSMIGAGSVVTRSVPPDVFAAGNPCRVIRSLA